MNNSNNCNYSKDNNINNNDNDDYNNNLDNDDNFTSLILLSDVSLDHLYTYLNNCLFLLNLTICSILRDRYIKNFSTLMMLFLKVSLSIA